MAENTQEQLVSFALRGVVTDIEPAKLADGQVNFASNIIGTQEGALTTALGRKKLGTLSTADITRGVMIRKLLVKEGENPYNLGHDSSGGTLQNPRYIEVIEAGHSRMYRTYDYVSFTEVATFNIATDANAVRKRFGFAPYSAGATGNPWAFFAGESIMLKDRGVNPYSALLLWGILPAFGVAVAVDSGVGVLDGGAGSSPAGSTPYGYVYAYVNQDTNNVGNPSQLMQSDSVVANGTPIAVHLREVTVTVYGTDDPQVSRIAIYRRGGVFTDGIWRLVGYVANPGWNFGIGAPFTATFVDNVSDVDITGATQAEFDNDPPVTSTVPQPITTTLAADPAGTGLQTVQLTAAIGTSMTRGSQVHFFGPNGVETVTLLGIQNSTHIFVYLQHQYHAGDTVEVDALIAQPGYLAISAFDAAFVAGDPNNPHVLYMSKPGRPESFPVGNSINVGTPANAIVNLTEFRGQILCFTREGLFEIAVSQGQMSSPAAAPTTRGLIAPWAWCKTDDEVWWLANDGIYSYDGATVTKRSDAIDRMFRGYITNGIAPIDYSKAEQATMEHCLTEFRFLFIDTNGIWRVLVCEPARDYRWTFRDYNRYNPDTTALVDTVQTIYREPDTGIVVSVRSNSGSGIVFRQEDAVSINAGDNYTEDEFTTTPIDPTAANGAWIAFDFVTRWIDLGQPFNKKLIEEVLLDIDPRMYGNSHYQALISCDIWIDYASSPSETISITPPNTAVDFKGRQPISLLPQLRASGGKQYGFGREVRAVLFHFYGRAWASQITFFGLMFRYQLTNILTAGQSMDWMDLGYDKDKKLYQMSVEFDSIGTDRTIVLDTLSGRDGKVYTEATQSFVLSNPTAVPGSTKVRKTFPVEPTVIAKMVRVRPASSLASGGLGSIDFFAIDTIVFDKEDFPADIVSKTPWDDGGNSYLKYLNQIVLEVNTNNVAITVKAQADGVDKFTFTVQATESDRQRFVTVPTGITGYRWRLFVDPAQSAIASGAGMFQLFNHSLKMQPADKGEVGHTFDWDELGHPWDKYLRTVTVEWDNTGGADVTMQLDTLSGIGGQTLNANVMQFTLSGGRGRKVFALPVDVICKMVRLYPVGGTIPGAFKQWKYTFDKEDYPADTILSTPWVSGGLHSPLSPVPYGSDFNPQYIELDADTENVACALVLRNETGAILNFSHTGTKTDRKRIYAVPADSFGKMWRLLATPGIGGKFQLFNWNVQRWTPTQQGAQDDAPDAILATPWNDFGWPFEKIPRNLILSLDTGGQSVSISLDADGQSMQTFVVSGTYTSRESVISCNPDLVGKLWRLRVTNMGSATKFKLWDWSLDAIKEPAVTNSWDSYEQALGYNGFKFLKQIWLEYISTTAAPGGIVFRVYADGNLFYNSTIPFQAKRGVIRILLPSATSVYNKAKVYRITLGQAGGTAFFKFYKDASRLEAMQLGAERRAGYQQFDLNEFQELKIGD